QISEGKHGDGGMLPCRGGGVERPGNHAIAVEERARDQERRSNAQSRPCPSPTPKISRRNRRTRKQGTISHSVDPHGLRDVLDSLLPEILVVELESAPDLLEYSGGNAQASGLRHGLEAGGEIDALTDQVVALDDDVP